MSFDITTVSPTSLGMALRCGESYRRRYVEGQRTLPGVAAGRGRGVHKANEANLKYKVVEKKDLPLSDLKDVARDGFIHSFDDGIFLPKSDMSAKDRILNDGLNEVISYTEGYHKKLAPLINPIEVEKKFTVKMDGIPLDLIGYIDYLQGVKDRIGIGDLKTTAKSWSYGQINTEIQPVFYSFAFEKLFSITPVFTFHILVGLKSGVKLDHQEKESTLQDYNMLRARIEALCRMLKTGTFPPAHPGNWNCSEKWCGYYRTCRYVGN